MKQTSAKQISLFAGLIILVVTSLVAGCGKERPKEPPAEVKSMDPKIEQFEVRRQEIQRELKGMKLADIYDRLRSESTKGVEQYNSLTYEEIISRGSNIAPELKSLILKSDTASLLPLIALREIDIKTYNTLEKGLRIRTLVNSLGTSNSFNVWGIPHLYWESAAKAIIDEGNDAVGPLKELLRDKRPAPVWGSEEAMEYEKYKYRVCDYAMALINDISQTKAAIPENSEERDKMIAAMNNK